MGKNLWFGEHILICYDELMGEIPLKKALDDYKTVYLAYRNLAQRTRIEYLNDLCDLIKLFEEWGIHHVKQVNLPAIERYLAKLEEKGYASQTRKRKAVTIRSFLLFLYHDGYIETNIGKRLILPFTESRQPKFLTQSECDRLQNACNDKPRDKAIVELFLRTGIKLSELTRLNVDDLEFEHENKGGSVRFR